MKFVSVFLLGLFCVSDFAEAELRRGGHGGHGGGGGRGCKVVPKGSLTW